MRSDHAEHIAQTRREALEAVELMSRSVSNKVAAERERGGLIILEAHYGLASAFTERGIRRHRPRPASNGGGDEKDDEAHEDEEDEEVVIDVTVPVQALIANSKLSIPGDRSKGAILGFWVSSCRLILARGSRADRDRIHALENQRSCASGTYSENRCTRSP